MIKTLFFYSPVYVINFISDISKHVLKEHSKAFQKIMERAEQQLREVGHVGEWNAVIAKIISGLPDILCQTF